LRFGQPCTGYAGKRVPSRLRVLALFCAVLLALHAVPAESAKSKTWGGDVRVEAFHCSDLFPGGDVSESDDGMRLVLRPEWNARVGQTMRTKMWAKASLEFYRHWTDRNLARWELGVDAKRGPHRLRLYAGTTPDELYFPSNAGGAFLARAHLGAEARAGWGGGWFAIGGVEYENENFVPNYNERDDQRWTFFMGGAREMGAGRRAELQYRFRRQDSTTNLYTYGQNVGRIDAEWSTAPIDAGVRLEYALREYRTGILSAANFARQDDRWRVLARLHRTVTGPVEAELFDEWKRTSSTRSTKNYEVNTVGLALTVSR
jgi:hypothetical protein